MDRRDMARRQPSTAAHDPAPTSASSQAKKTRQRLSQEDVPSYPLDQALRVPEAIAENYAFKPTQPLNVAGAMRMSPTSGPFRMITGAAVAYGLTTAAAQAPEIGLTPLGTRIVRPTAEGDDLAAMREALLRPKIIGEFLRTYDGAALPSDGIAKNVLLDKGVPGERLDGVLELIVEGARAVGFIREWNGKRYVDLAASATPAVGEDTAPARPEAQTAASAPPSVKVAPPTPAVSVGPGIHINIEIHIAADASSETIEEIFRNMRRYVLADDRQADNATTATE
jgi:hypothetical protein